MPGLPAGLLERPEQALFATSLHTFAVPGAVGVDWRRSATDASVWAIDRPGASRWTAVDHEGEKKRTRRSA